MTTSKLCEATVCLKRLVIIYINDIVNIHPDAKFALYADDSNIFMSDSLVSSLSLKMQLVCDRLSDWCNANGLIINTNKTVAILFAAKNKSSDAALDLSIDSRSITVVDSVRFLGVHFDKQLIFDEHVNFLVSSLAKACGVLNRCRFLLPARSKMLLYNSFIVSRLNYCILAYGTASKTHLDKLHRIQKRALRAVFNLSYSQSVSAITYLPIHEMYANRLRKIFCSRQYNLQFYYAELANLQDVIQTYHTRSQSRFRMPKPSREYSRLKIGYQLPSILNSKLLSHES